MTTELTVHGGQSSTALTIAADQTAFNPAQVASLRHLGVEGADDADLAVFFHVAKRTGLDPFARQIHMIGRNTFDQRTNGWVTKQTIQTGIDGFRLIGRRAADAHGQTISIAAPQWAHQDGGWRDVWTPSWGMPIAARVTIKRNGEPFTAVALFDEYKQTKRGGDLTSMWAQRPAGQIAKCAEALAWRMAFPQDLSGLYVDEEMQQADDEQPRQANPERSGTARLRAAVPASEAPEPPDTSAHVAEPADVEPLMTSTQSKKMHALFKDAGISDHDLQISGISHAIGREIASKTDLTEAEADLVIAALEERKRQHAATPAATAEEPPAGFDDQAWLAGEQPTTTGRGARR